MARMARMKLERTEAWYHVHCQIAGTKGHYPLIKPLCQKKLIDLLRFYSKVYCCELASFCIMGNHWHGILRFDSPKEFSRDELMRYARRFYPSRKSVLFLDNWTEAQWQRFNKRIFDISEFMRNVQSAFATWYNRIHQRRGKFWADRYKSVCLGDLRAVQDCMLYVDLNPVRAGLVKRPEQWKSSSSYFRDIGKADWLLRLKMISDHKQESKALLDYRSRLYHRGNVPTKPGQAKIPDTILEDEQHRGFTSSGTYLKRIRYFADGLAIGSEMFVREQLAHLRHSGYYKRRCHPIVQANGPHLSIREQRRHAVAL